MHSFNEEAYVKSNVMLFFFSMKVKFFPPVSSRPCRLSEKKFFVDAFATKPSCFLASYS